MRVLSTLSLRLRLLRSAVIAPPPAQVSLSRSILAASSSHGVSYDCIEKPRIFQLHIALARDAGTINLQKLGTIGRSTHQEMTDIVPQCHSRSAHDCPRTKSTFKGTRKGCTFSISSRAI